MLLFHFVLLCSFPQITNSHIKSSNSPIIRWRGKTPSGKVALWSPDNPLHSVLPIAFFVPGERGETTLRHSQQHNVLSAQFSFRWTSWRPLLRELKQQHIGERVPGLMDGLFAFHADCRGFYSHGRHISHRFLQCNWPENLPPVRSELEKVVSQGGGYGWVSGSSFLLRCLFSILL